jgi:hypothetical protein
MVGNECQLDAAGGTVAVFGDDQLGLQAAGLTGGIGLQLFVAIAVQQ